MRLNGTYSVPNIASKPTSVWVYDPYADEGWFVDPDPVPVAKGNADMKITWDIKNTLVASARDELDKAKKAVAEAEVALTLAQSKVVEKQATVNWANGLVVGADLSMQPLAQQTPAVTGTTKRYFVPSKSGRRFGHYITQTDAGFTCTCPGFLNRNYCHATRTIQQGKNIWQYAWLLPVRDFERQREQAVEDSRKSW